MKKIITLGLFLSFAMTQFAQKLDYDNDSKWFFGLNTGAAWNTTDVKNKTHIGWGFILGRSFNYNYGKKVSFDLRMRYLHGKWYGQDYDTTSTLGYNSEYTPVGNVLQHYDTLGYTVNNFQTDVHELGLELAIHLNSIRETKGWDPYIFGGANIVWNQTYGDLYTHDTIDGGQYAYNYSPAGLTKPEWDLLSDDIYDSALDGSSQDKYNVDFMPSLGIGLGYQVGPRFSVGVEHKTTFALKDVFDGYVNPEKRWGLFENDIYHYTSAYLKFNFRNRHREQHTETTTDTGGGGDLPMGSGDCDDPRIRISKPGSSSITVDSREYKIVARFDHVAGRDNIQFSLNSNSSTNFAYNAANGNFEAPVFLEPGMNTIVLSAGNACGRDEETININYVPCVVPTVNMINPAGGSINVEQGSYTVNASVSGATSIEFYVDGIRSSSFTFNASTGAFSSRLNLKDGANIIRIVGVSDCGTDDATVNINYTECADPAVNIAGNNTINVDQPTFDLSGFVANVESKNDISFTVNGANKTFIYNANSNSVQSVVSLNVGSNTIVLSASNDCGNDSETITVVYTPCVAPQIQMVVPSQTSIITEAGSQQIQAQLFNVVSNNQITLTVNGVTQSAGSFNANTHVFNKTVSLNAGTNTIRLSVDNGCGIDTRTIVVTYRPCIAPVITMVAPSTANSATTNGTMLIKAMVTNVASTNNIMLKVNGQILTGGTYNTSTNIFERAVSLSSGNNTIQITANGDCDSDTETFTVNYSDCADPVVSMILPTSVNSTTSNNTAMVKAIVSNVTSSSQIVLKVNGVVVSGGTFNAATQVFQKTVSLNAGANLISITGTNDCGMVCETITINYTPCINPVVTMIAPIVGTTNVATANVQASILNVNGVNDIQLTVNGSVITGGTYNSTTKIFTKTVNLNPGQNVIQLTASTNCGTDTKTATVTYNRPCEEPVVTMISPVNGSTTPNMNQLIKATVTNVTSVNQIQLKVNGVTISGGTYNNATQIFEKTVALTKGANVVLITATNECGVDTESTTVNFVPCLSPVVTMVAPLVTSSSVQNQAYVVKATILNINNAAEAQVKLNGAVQGAGSYNSTTKLFTKSLNLANGTNTIEVKATTNCGTNSKVFTIAYNPCLEPSILIEAPTTLSSTTSAATFLVQATLMNVSSVNQVTLTQNGNVVSGATLNGASFSKNVNLVKGLNRFVITVTTECGTATQSFELNYVPCVEPIITFIKPAKQGSTVSTESITIQAEITGINSVNAVVLDINGIVKPGGNYNAQTAIYVNTVSLVPGANVITFKVSNECGTYTESRTINYQPCIDPTVSIISPSNNDSLATNTVLLKANVQNAQSVSQIKLIVNGSIIGGATYNTATGAYEKLITLGLGENDVKISVNNACGRANDNIKLYYGQCQEPIVWILATGTAHTTPTMLARAQIHNISSASQVKFYLNGNLVTGGTYDANSLYYEKSVTLNAGSNTLRFEATNDCGETIETGTAVYAPCTLPTVTMSDPSSDITTGNSSYLVKATVNGVTSGSQLQMIVNGVPVTGATYFIITKTYQKNVQLADGDNVIQVIATTNCGVVSDQIIITKGAKSTGQMITICHKEGGKSTTMQIPISDWPKHQAHGDQLGTCKATPIKNQGKPKAGTEDKPKPSPTKEKGEEEKVEKTKETEVKELEIKTGSTPKKKTKGGK